MTPYGQAGTQYPQPLQMSCWTTTVPNSVRNSAPVGQTSRQPACVQCLQTSEDISQRTCLSVPLCPVCGSNSLSASALSTEACAFASESWCALAGDPPEPCRSSPGRPKVGIGRATGGVCPTQPTAPHGVGA